jgi:hypothetical protein
MQCRSFSRSPCSVCDAHSALQCLGNPWMTRETRQHVCKFVAALRWQVRKQRRVACQAMTRPGVPASSALRLVALACKCSGDQDVRLMKRVDGRAVA